MHKKIVIGKPKGIRPVGKPRRMWENGIQVGLTEFIYEECGPDPSDLKQGPVASSCGTTGFHKKPEIASTASIERPYFIDYVKCAF
jgi:hypothetical protein